MSRISSAAIDHQLTAFAVAHTNNILEADELSQRLCPLVPVAVANGQFKKFDDKNSFALYGTSRALGGDPTRIKFEATDGSYNCKPQALEVTVDQEEERQVGDSALAQQLLDEGKIKALLNLRALSSVKKRVDAVLAGVAAEAAPYGQWSNPDIDPIEQIDEIVDQLATVCGSTAFIKVTMSLSAWRTIRNHPKTKARCNGVQVGTINMQQFMDILAVPVDSKAFAISYDEKALGITASKKRLLPSDVLIHYSVPNPTQYDPSAFKCFVAGASNVTSVRSYQSPNGLYRGHFVDWSEDIEQTSTQAIKRINIS